MYFSTFIIGMIESRKMIWAGLVARMGKNVDGKARRKETSGKTKT
jgi:hypothetical protein